MDSAADGVQCHTPDGEAIGKICTPEVVANLAFGGPRNNRLFITATTSVFAVFLNVAGHPTRFAPQTAVHANTEEVAQLRADNELRDKVRFDIDPIVVFHIGRELNGFTRPKHLPPSLTRSRRIECGLFERC